MKRATTGRIAVIGAASITFVLLSLCVVDASAEADQGPSSQPASQPASRPARSPLIDVPSHRHEVGDAFFTCPMHPEVHGHQPGRCPLCKMKLAKRTVDAASTTRWLKKSSASASATSPASSKRPPESDRPSTERPSTQRPSTKDSSATSATPLQVAPEDGDPASMPASMPASLPASSPATSAMPGDDEVAYYTCSMHPTVREHEPGDCPICGMTLTPVTKGELRTGVVVVDSVRRQLIGVKTAPVVERPLTKQIRALGRVELDETRIVDVTVQTHGWVEGLRVKETGQFVKRGQTLAWLYSPEVVAAQDELVLALASRASASRDAASLRADAMVRGARGKLKSLGLQGWQIDRIAEAKKSQRTFAVVAPTSGYVVAKDIVEGAHVPGGSRLFRLVPLDRVWAVAEVYARDFPWVEIGQAATARSPTGSELSGSIDWIYPNVSAKTQTGRVRVELDNQETTLRPGMFVDVELEVPLGPRLVIPTEAVLYTGRTRLVFTDVGEGRLLPVVIEVGAEAGDLVEVTRGLHAGQQVVTSGAFLIAAESRLKSAASYWGRAPDADAAVGDEQVEGHDHGDH